MHVSITVIVSYQEVHSSPYQTLTGMCGIDHLTNRAGQTP